MLETISKQRLDKHERMLAFLWPQPDESYRGMLILQDGSRVMVEFPGGETEVLQLCRQPVIGWPDAPPGLFGLRSVQVAPI
jgi:hypothetical protein